jgi:hypothetical protein
MINVKKIQISILLLLTSMQTLCENQIHLGMFSTHFEDGSYNEVHNLIGLEFDSFFLHRFKNSNGETNYFLGKIKRDGVCIDKLCLGYSYGIMKGYEFEEYLPAIFGVISYERDSAGFDISCFPSIVCAIQFRFSDEAFKALDLIPIWDAKGYLEVALDHYDSDDPSRYGYHRNNGADYQLKLYLKDKTYLKWGYTSTDATIKADQSNNKFPSGWKTKDPSTILSKGYFMAGHDFDSFSLGVSYNQVSIQENVLDINQDSFPLSELPKTTHNGYGVHASKNFKLSDNTNAYLELAVIDTLITDSRITAELRHNITDSLEVTLRTIDYEKWNSSHYQLGIRYRFN